jgi:beta-galactosidase/beta-glucuronidase
VAAKRASQADNGSQHSNENLESVQRVSEQTWRYRHLLQKPNAPDGHRVQLVFEGLDTYCKIAFNGAVLAETHNMFLRA